MRTEPEGCTEGAQNRRRQRMTDHTSARDDEASKDGARLRKGAGPAAPEARELRLFAPASGSQMDDAFESSSPEREESGGSAPPLQVLSFGAGQDSSALLEMWLSEPGFRRCYPARQLLVVFSDTGDEHPETYAHLRRTEARLRHRSDVDFFWLRPEMGYHSEKWPSLTAFWKRTRTIGSKAFPKTCTERLKISVIYRFLEEYLAGRFALRHGRKKGFYDYAVHYGRLPVLIGISAEEQTRIQGEDAAPRWMQRCIRRIYPLVELEMTRADCQAVLARHGEIVPVPSMCQKCPFKDERLLPEVLAAARREHGHLSTGELEHYRVNHYALKVRSL